MDTQHPYYPIDYPPDNSTVNPNLNTCGDLPAGATSISVDVQDGSGRMPVAGVPDEQSRWTATIDGLWVGPDDGYYTMYVTFSNALMVTIAQYTRHIRVSADAAVYMGCNGGGNPRRSV